MAAEIDVPDFKLKLEGPAKKKAPWLPRRNAQGRYTIGAFLNCGVGQLVFIGAVMSAAFSYGNIQKPVYKQYTQAQAELAADPNAMVKKKKQKKTYDGVDVSQLPTDMSRGDSMKMTWGY